jgi:hypothetical protein
VPLSLFFWGGDVLKGQMGEFWCFFTFIS